MDLQYFLCEKQDTEVFAYIRCILSHERNTEEKRRMHSHMKGMFLCKHAKQDLLPGIVFFATRVKQPNKEY
jgi:hypothetical protein